MLLSFAWRSTRISSQRNWERTHRSEHKRHTHFPRNKSFSYHANQTLLHNIHIKSKANRFTRKKTKIHINHSFTSLQSKQFNRIHIYISNFPILSHEKWNSFHFFLRFEHMKISIWLRARNPIIQQREVGFRSVLLEKREPTKSKMVWTAKCI